MTAINFTGKLPIYELEKRCSGIYRDPDRNHGRTQAYAHGGVEQWQ